MKYISLVDQTVSSTSGHSVGFKAGVPTFVPPVLRPEMKSYGIVAEEEMSDAVKTALLNVSEAEAEPEPSFDAEPTDPAARREAFFSAFTKLRERGQRENFLSNGVPHNRPLLALMKFRVSALERDRMWEEFQAEQTA
jgi:uncharacterized protein (DUF2249 family)